MSRWLLLPALAVALFGSSTAFAQFSYRTVTNDADALLPGAGTYTHAVDLNSDDGGAVINGVTFTAGAASGTGYTLTGTDGAFQGHNSAAADASGLDDLLDDFFFMTQPGAQDEVLTLTGLTPGVTYRTTFLNSGFGGPRNQTVSADNTAVPTTFSFDQDAAPLSALDYVFTLPAGDTDIRFTFDATGGVASFHQYGFANAVIPEPASLGLIGLPGAALLRGRRRQPA